MTSRLKQTITPLMALVTVLAVLFGTGGASGEGGQPGSEASTTSAASGSGTPEHHEIIDHLPVPGIDVGAEPPSVDGLWSAYRAAERCLENGGFTMVGPIAGSDGSRLLYLVYSPDGGPILAPSNACEDPLKTNASAFERAASTEARAHLVDEFRATMSCLGFEAEPLAPDEVRAGHFTRDIASEDLVMRRLMASTSDDHRCADRHR